MQNYFECKIKIYDARKWKRARSIYKCTIYEVGKYSALSGQSIPAYNVSIYLIDFLSIFRMQLTCARRLFHLLYMHIASAAHITRYAADDAGWKERAPSTHTTTPSHTYMKLQEHWDVIVVPHVISCGQRVLYAPELLFVALYIFVSICTSYECRGV